VYITVELAAVFVFTIITVWSVGGVMGEGVGGLDGYFMGL